jgi:hypothetical protein
VPSGGGNAYNFKAPKSGGWGESVAVQFGADYVYVLVRKKFLKVFRFESPCKWRCEASFVSWTLYHRGVILLYPLFGGSMGGHNRSGRCGDEKAVGLAVIGTGIRMFGCPAGGLATVPAEDTLRVIA